MNAPEPYAFIEELCHVSLSQEKLLSRCRFAGELPAPDDPRSEHETEDDDDVFGDIVKDELPMESARIVMVSLPETPPQGGIPRNTPPCDDVFHTLPEAEASSRNSDALEAAVDLGRDTDLVFSSKADWTERIEGREIRVSGGELGLEAEAGGKLGTSLNNREESCSQSKRLKISNEGLVSDRLKVGFGVEGRRRREDLGKSVEEPNQERIGHHWVEEVCGESYSKRKLEFSDQVLVSDKKVGVSDLGLGFSDGRGRGVRIDQEVRSLARKSIDDINKFRYVGRGGAGSSGKEMDTNGKRTLPASVRGWTDGTGGTELKADEATRAKELKEVTLLDVLKMLAEHSNYDHSVENLSVLEAAKRRGMTFP